MTTVQETRAAQRWVGAPVPRKEDRRLLQGQGEFTDDIALPRMVHAALARSPHPHARIIDVDASGALELPGVIAVITGREVAGQVRPFSNLLAPPYDRVEDYGIAVEVARYVGEPVAIVVAEDKYLAHDAVELVEVQYEPLPAVTSPLEGMQGGSPLVHENVPSNVMWQRRMTYGDVEGAFREAELVVRDRLRFHRFSSAPLECNVVLADYDRRHDTFTIWSNNQRPGFNQRFIASAMQVPTTRLRFINPDIGGGFGIKNDTYPYLMLMAIAARRVNRPVKWVETRTEHMQACAHGTEVTYDGEMALRSDGTILGLRARAVHDEGAYMRREPIGAFNFIRHATVTYTFRNLEMDIYTVATNKCPVGPNRSYGKMQQCYLVERLLERGARELGLDPVEIRQRNFVPPELMPFEMPTGSILDGGDYPRALNRVAEMMDYRGLREEQARNTYRGRLLGVGVGVGMDACPINFGSNRIINPGARASGDSEAAWVKIDEMGGISAAVGTSPQGHGHETSVSQIVAEELGVSPDDVYVVSGFDSAVQFYTPHSGTYASRFAITGAPAVLYASQKVRDKVLRLASHALGEPVERLRLADGNVLANGGERSMSLEEIAHLAWRDIGLLPEEEEPGLLEKHIHSVPFRLPVDEQRGNFSLTYSYAMCMVAVEVDRETGAVHVRRLGMVEDCGKKINPMIIEGQVHGQIGHQLGAALYERLHYDEEGQLLSSSFKDYLAPSAADMPSFEVDSIEVPSPFTPLGTRGTGEGGGAPIMAAVNAVEDALGHLGVRLTDTFLDPPALHRLIEEGGER